MVLWVYPVPDDFHDGSKRVQLPLFVCTIIRSAQHCSQARWDGITGHSTHIVSTKPYKRWWASMTSAAFGQQNAKPNYQLKPDIPRRCGEPPNTSYLTLWPLPFCIIWCVTLSAVWVMMVQARSMQAGSSCTRSPRSHPCRAYLRSGRTVPDGRAGPRASVCQTSGRTRFFPVLRVSCDGHYLRPQSGEDALAAAHAGANAIGRSFYANSPRHVGLRQAAEICAALPPFVTNSVGLFVNPEAEEVATARSSA